MALTSSYLVSVKNVSAFFDSLTTAKAPSAFTQKFIEGLGFKSTNDRLYIGVLKGLGFLDTNAIPTERYFKFLDGTISKKILAESIEDAYGDLFDVHKKAYELSTVDVKNKLRTLTLGKYSEKVVSLMATTFKALSAYAEWGDIKKESPTPPKVEQTETDGSKKESPTPPPEVELPKLGTTPQFHYNIQVHLPESRDESVYDAIFKSLRRHLL